MSTIGTNYSFKDLSGAFASPLAGDFLFSGNIGEGQVVVSNTTEHTVIETAPDGTTMTSAIVGDSGSVSIQCQQTSTLDKFLLLWHNLHLVAAKAGDVSQWSNSVLLLRNSVNGTAHECSGVSPQKVPDVTYGAQGAYRTWILPAAEILNV